jgi:cytochrome bd ubiquinol oxidase subunit II
MEIILAGSMLASLTFYALTGGADYGGGVWELFARGPRARQQSDLIAHAIGPIWEANHVWLILVIVILFTAFPNAFAIITTYLHIPLTLMLIGVVFRGSAFAFRTYASEELRRRWGFIFATTSVITPVLLGISIGAISSGNIPGSITTFHDAFIAPWLAPFPFCVGILTLALFAQLAAVYLTLETSDNLLIEDFRKRAVWTSVAVVLLAAVTYLMAAKDARPFFITLHLSGWQIKFGAAALAAGNLLALWKRSYRVARFCSGGETILILWGWAFAQFPFLVVPLTTITDAAPQATLRLLLIALVAGAILLFPSFYYLFRVFKLERH